MDSPTAATLPKPRFFVNVLYNFAPSEKNQLTLRTNEIIGVIEEDESGWWIGVRSNSEFGIFPSNYVSVVDKPSVQILREFGMETGGKLPAAGPASPLAAPAAPRQSASSLGLQFLKPKKDSRPTLAGQVEVDKKKQLMGDLGLDIDAELSQSDGSISDPESDSGDLVSEAVKGIDALSPTTRRSITSEVASLKESLQLALKEKEDALKEAQNASKQASTSKTQINIMKKQLLDKTEEVSTLRREMEKAGLAVPEAAASSAAAAPLASSASFDASSKSFDEERRQFQSRIHELQSTVAALQDKQRDHQLQLQQAVAAASSAAAISVSQPVPASSSSVSSEQLTALESEIAKAREALASEQSKAQQAARRIAEAENEIQSLKDRLAAASLSASSSASSSQEDSVKFAALQSALDKATSDSSALRSQLSESKAQVEEKERALQSAIASKQEIESSMSKKLAAAESATSALKEELSSSQSQIERLKTALDSSSQDASSSTKQLQSQLSEALEKSSSLSSQVSTLRQELDSKTHEAFESSASLQAAQSQVQILQGRLESALASQSSSEESNKSLTSKMEQLSSQLEQSQKRLGEATSQVKAAEKDNEELLTHAAELSKKVDELEAAVGDVATLRKELSGKDAEIQKLQRTISSLRTQKKAMVALGAQLQASVHEMRSQVVDLRPLVLTRVKDMSSSLIAPLSDSFGRLGEEVDNTMQLYKKEARERRRLYNLVQELRGNIRCFFRCRPLLPEEAARGSTNALRIDSKDGFLEVMDVSHSKTHRYEFDACFDPESTQVDVFEQVKPLATSVADGYNVCLFAYGQTGSGKTYTMEGKPDDRGVNYRMLDECFKVIAERAGQYTYVVQVSVLEVYNENVYDLLCLSRKPRENKIELRQGPDGIFAENIVLVPVRTVEDVSTTLATGYKNRSVGATNANEHSSRSHCILSVFVEGTNISTNVKSRGRLNLVDLAGSERLKKTEAEGDRLKEAQAINKSLSSLGDVMAALATKSQHIPYRNSKLTYLLQDSLGGDSKTSMFVNCSPTSESVGETLCSLNFATRVRTVELGKASKHASSGAAPSAAAASSSSAPEASGPTPGVSKLKAAASASIAASRMAK